MFPFDIEDDEVEVEEKEEIPYREYEIDFSTGQLTGRIVEGKEAVKVWVYLALNTARYYFQQYTWNYGNELDELIGKSSDREYIEMETQRMIKECLLQNEHILGMTKFSIEVEDGKITAEFTIETDYGEVEASV